MLATIKIANSIRVIRKPQPLDHFPFVKQIEDEAFILLDRNGANGNDADQSPKSIFHLH
jgi:hypothetical protein